MVLYSLYYNFRLHKGFQQKEYLHTYAEEIAKDTIDPQSIYKMFSGISTLIGSNFRDDIKSPIEIHYYSDIDDDIPALVVEKGTTVHVDSNEVLNGECTFQGINSLPAEKKGWRLVKPFAVDGRGPEEVLFYVKMSDLMHVASAWMEKNPQAMKTVRQRLMNQGLLPTKANVCRQMLLTADRELYRKGMYLSKDVMQPVFPPEVVVCLGVSAGMLACILGIALYACVNYMLNAAAGL